MRPDIDIHLLLGFDYHHGSIPRLVEKRLQNLGLRSEGLRFYRMDTIC